MRTLWITAWAAMVWAQAGRPVPDVQAVPLPRDEVSFQRREQEIARLYLSRDLARPFVYPLIGPSGRPLTRMGHPGDPFGHSHHNSVWVSLSDLNGTDFWIDRGPGRIRHLRTELLEDGERDAFVIAHADWTGADGVPILKERRHTGVRVLDNGEWLLLLELELSPAGNGAVIGKGSFGPIGVRMAKWIGVHHGGGRLRNSEGLEGEQAIFRTPARWVDYSGQVATGVVEGLTLLDHPSNPRHPAKFHVREDGWMGAMFTVDEPYRIGAGETLRLRYGVFVHAGMPAANRIDEVWRRFASEPLRPAVGPPVSEKDCRHGDHLRYTVPRPFRSARECEAFVRAGK